VGIPQQSGEEDGILGTEALHIACTEEVSLSPGKAVTTVYWDINDGVLFGATVTAGASQATLTTYLGRNSTS
jgi:hypothetical protein